MKKVMVILSMLLLFICVINISSTSIKDNSSKVHQNTSLVNSIYQDIKQDGYINLGYDDDKENNEFMIQRSSVNMVNFDMSTRSKSFESFDPNSYINRSGSNSLSLARSGNTTLEDEDATIVHSTMVEGKKCLYTEGYPASVKEYTQKSVLVNTNDPNDNRELVSNSKTSPYLATGQILTYYYNVKNLSIFSVSSTFIVEESIKNVCLVL